MDLAPAKANALREFRAMSLPGTKFSAADQPDQPPTSPADILLDEDVLVVEDNRVEQVRLEAMLRKFGYQVHCANNGGEALDQLRRHPIRLVVTDWRMPEMTGIDLCRTLRGDAAFEQPYVILVTGRNTKSDLVAGMDAGADDFISKPFGSEELRVRLQAGARIVRLRSELERRHRQLEKTMAREAEANAVIRKDLDAAARMQRDLLPDATSPFPELQMSTLFMPAVEVTGDTFNFFKLDDEHLAFYHIDVAGHGIASAMLSFTLSRILSPKMEAIGLLRDGRHASGDGPLATHITPPSEVVTALNHRFVDHGDDSLYFTMVYGVIHVPSGLCVLCQAGHPHPLLAGSHRQVQKLGSGGFPVGMLEQASYEDVEVTLQPGDRLFLYSDGITDVTNADDEVFGSDRLASLLKCSKGCQLNAGLNVLADLLQRWKGDAAPDDDISMLAIGYR